MPDLSSLLTFQTQLAFRWVETGVERLEGSDWLAHPGGVKNHAYWLYGHIAVSSDLKPVLYGGDSVVPADWHRFFGIGSAPAEEGAAYPPVSEITAVIERARDRNLKLIAGLDADGLAEPPAVDLPGPIARFLSTRERYLGLQMQHLTYHAGQIRQIAAALHPDPSV